jgi:hypothetical protein
VPRSQTNQYGGSKEGFYRATMEIGRKYHGLT